MSIPYAGVICPVHDKVDLSQQQYVSQLAEVNAFWRCPTCNQAAQFDDARYEQLQADRENHLFCQVQLSTNPGDEVQAHPEFIEGVDDSIKAIVFKHLKALTTELNELQG